MLLARAARGLQWRVSARRRVLPDFMIIGAQKAGTTSLYDQLTALPGVCGARKKEIRFFDRHWARGEIWYRWNFPTRREVRDGVRPRISGEATPDYLPHPLVPQRVAELLPECRLIVLLRDPVDRAHSQYHMNLALGVEDRGFVEAIDAEMADLARGDDPGVWDDERRHHTYVARSRYHPQLARWLAHFPPSALHVSTLERILDRPQDEIERVAEFLDVDHPEVAMPFMGSNRRAHRPPSPEERDLLFPLFAEDLTRTEELLGWSLGYRREAGPPGTGVGGR